MELAQGVTEALERICSAGRVEVQEDGTWLAALEGFRYEVREHGEIVLLHLWSEQRSLVRRVLGFADRLGGRKSSEDKADEPNPQAPDHLALEVERFGRPLPSRLDFAVPATERSAGRIVREQFRIRFRDLLAEHFPDEKIASLTCAADLKHSLSGNYTRGVLEASSHAWAVMGAAPEETPATWDGMLTFGLLWLDRTHQSARRGSVAGLRLFFPRGSGRATAHRLRALSPSTNVEIYEYSTEAWRAHKLDASDMGNVDTWLVPRREVESTLSQAAPAIERIRRLAPGAIDAEVAPGSSEVALRFRGVLFARWEPAGISFGFADPHTPLTPDRETELIGLVRELEARRSPVASATKDPWYRAQPERWLQSLVATDPARVDPRLDPRFLYAQVPAFSSGDRGIMDLLGVTRDARLAVIELKASEDIQLVMQGVDYWLRVRWHQAQQDFLRYGYFPGIALDPRPPLLFLVAPSLQFHPSSDMLLRYLSPEIEICRVGVSESWRRVLRVVLRQGPT
jgi:hypothetical protein